MVVFQSLLSQNKLFSTKYRPPVDLSLRPLNHVENSCLEPLRLTTLTSKLFFSKMILIEYFLQLELSCKFRALRANAKICTSR